MTPITLPLIEDDRMAASADADRPGCGQLLTRTGERLPLKRLTVESKIVGLAATSGVRQEFANTGDTTIECTYIFPLPARAGVTDFVATLGGRRVVGILKERGQARVEYEEAVAAGQRAAIVEEDRSDVFTVRVGNLGPGEEAVIDLVLTGPLEVQEGEATFRFPLVVAPRYTTGTPVEGDQTGTGLALDTAAVPDASRVTPPRLLPEDVRPELSVRVSIDGAGLALSDLRTSLHSTVVSEEEGGVRIVRLEAGDRADRDFLLRFKLDRSTLTTSAVLVPDPPADSTTDDMPVGTTDGTVREGTWSLTLIAPVEPTSAPRDVVVVLDRSGSMGGWKMVAARRAAGRLVDMLDAGDRFCVIAFDDRIETPGNIPSALVEASDRNRFAASSWLGSLESRGGTEMAQPLVAAATMLGGSAKDRRSAMVLVTDGQITGEDHLLNTLRPSLGRTTIHCVGIDRAVNAGFLDRLARLGNGRSELVESEDRLDEVMVALARAIGRPALTDIHVSAEGIELIPETETPAGSVDAFAGVPRVVSGRYRRLEDSSKAMLVVTAGEKKFRAGYEPMVCDADAVRTIWARGLLRDLEDSYAGGSARRPGLKERIVAHSLRFGVLSRFTAFVAVDPEKTDSGPLEEVTQPVELPSGWVLPAPLSGAPIDAWAAAAYAQVDAAMPMPTPGLAGSPVAGRAAGGALGARGAAARPNLHRPRLLRRIATRSLDELLLSLDRALSDASVDLVSLRRELAETRDRASTELIRSALDRLLAAVDAFATARTMHSSADPEPVRRAMEEVRAAAGRTSRSKLRFWE